MAPSLGKSGYLGREECQLLADSLPDTPENVIPGHLLRLGLCDAYARSDLTSFDAAVVRPTSLPEETFGLGADAASIWDNMASLRVAHKLGFTEVSRLTYVIRGDV